MPRLVESTIQIGLQAQRDILFLTFKNERNDDDVFGTHWSEHQGRQHVVAWLEANAIPWDPCVHVRPGVTPDLSVSAENLVLLVRGWIARRPPAVSYTHLTLPTKRIV